MLAAESRLFPGGYHFLEADRPITIKAVAAQGRTGFDVRKALAFWRAKP